MLKRFLNNDLTLKILALAMAFAAWLLVVENMDRESYAQYRDIPIDMSNVENSISTLGLNSISPEVDVVSVNVSGVMYAVGNLSREDITVTPDISKVTGAGVYELPLVGSVKGTDVSVTSINPSRITVRFDTLHSKVLTIESQLDGLRSEPGYLIRDELVNPAQVTITGPEAEVSRVSSCQVRTTVEGTLSETYSKKSELILLDKSGNPIESDSISMDVREATVTIPVLKIREIPVELRFMNVPKNFPLEELDFSLSQESIQVAGAAASIDRYSSILLDQIDLKQLGIGSSYAFPVTLQNGFWNVENIQSVQVTLSNDSLASRKINLEDIQVINVPLGYEAQALAQQLTDVELLGDAHVLETLSAEDLVAEVDMGQSSQIEAGQLLMPVKIYAPGGQLVWARGDYEVVVAISLAAEEAD